MRWSPIRGRGPIRRSWRWRGARGPAVVADAAQILGRRGAPPRRRGAGPADRPPGRQCRGQRRSRRSAAWAGRPRSSRWSARCAATTSFAPSPAIGVLGSAATRGRWRRWRRFCKTAATSARRRARWGAVRRPRGRSRPLAALLGRSRHCAGGGGVALADLIERHQLRFGPSPAARSDAARGARCPSWTALERRWGQADAGEQAALCALLGRLGDPALIAALATLLDGEPGSPSAAARALERLAHQSDAAIRQALRHADSAHRAALLPLFELRRRIS